MSGRATPSMWSLLVSLAFLAAASRAGAQPYARFDVPDSLLETQIAKTGAPFESAWNVLLVAELRAAPPRARLRLRRLGLWRAASRRRKRACARNADRGHGTGAAWQSGRRTSAPLAFDGGARVDRRRGTGARRWASPIACCEKRSRTIARSASSAARHGCRDDRTGGLRGRRHRPHRQRLFDLRWWPGSIGDAQMIPNTPQFPLHDSLPGRDYVQARMASKARGAEKTGERGPLGATLNSHQAPVALGQPDSARGYCRRSDDGGRRDSLRTAEVLHQHHGAPGRRGSAGPWSW
jgi:hypothetical protein